MAAVTFDRNAVGNLSGVLAVASMNDNWIKFSGQSDPEYADIEVDNGTTQKTFRISPDANNDFYFNVKEAVLSFFTEATDDFDYTSNEINPADLWQSIDFNITINHTSSPDDTGTVSANFIKSKRIIPDSIFIQSPGNLSEKIVLFNGYPLCGVEITDTALSRKKLSDGSTIDDINDIYLRDDADNILTDDAGNELEIDRGGVEVKETEDCGTYLKWLNNLGGYSYWLFNHVQIDNHQISDNGKTVNTQIDESNFPFLELDKTETIRRSIESTAKDRNEVALFKSLIRSKEVYLYTGEKGDVADESTWMRVKTVPNSYSFSSKFSIHKLRLQIELPV